MSNTYKHKFACKTKRCMRKKQKEYPDRTTLQALMDLSYHDPEAERLFSDWTNKVSKRSGNKRKYEAVMKKKRRKSKKLKEKRRFDQMIRNI